MLSLLSSLALAEDPTFVGTDKAPPPELPPEAVATLSADLGGMLASGNTETFTLNVGLHGGVQKMRNKFRLDLGANVGQSIVDGNGDGHLDDLERDAGRVETARKVAGEGRYDRFLGVNTSLYGLAGAYTDRFSGYDSRSHAQVGVSQAFVKTEKTSLLGELGADVARENYIADVDLDTETIFAARAMVGFEQKLSENAALVETVEVYENVLDTQDARLLNTFGVTSKITKAISLNVSHGLIYDNVPVEGFRKLDQTVMVTFVATIL